MRLIPNQNAASSKLTVTNTATSVFSLIDTSGSVTNTQKYFNDPELNGIGVANGILITPEDGNIRMGNGITPTSVNGTLLSQGTKYFFPNVTLPSLKFIRVTGDTVCSVDFAVCETGDTYSAVAETVALEGSITVGSVTIADGSDATQGAKADARSTATDTTAVSAMQVLKEISYMEQNPASRAVTGTFWQATQPVSAATLPLPTGASTSALQGGGLPAALGAGGGLKVDGSGTALPVSGTFYQATQPVSIATMPSTPVTGTFYQATQPVSAATLPLPTGAATSALQGGGLPAALGAGGGVKVDGSGTALPVSGTVTANATLAAETTKVIGTVNVAAAQTIATTNAGTFAVQAASAGDVANDGVDSGNPIKIGFKAYTFDGTIPQTAVAEADRVNGIADLQGIQYVQTAHPFFFSATADYSSAQTNATVQAAPGAGSLYITDIIVSNGATAGKITLLDGSGGTVKFTCYPGINGGLTHRFVNPIKLTATTLLAITSTTVTTHSVTVNGFTA